MNESGYSGEGLDASFEVYHSRVVVQVLDGQRGPHTPCDVGNVVGWRDASSYFLHAFKPQGVLACLSEHGD